MGLAFYFLKKY